MYVFTPGRGDAPGLRGCLHRTCHTLHGGVSGETDHAQLPLDQDPPLHPQQCTQRLKMSEVSDWFWERVWLVLIYPWIQVVYHERHIQKFWEHHRYLFPDALIVGPEENLKEDKARTMAVWVQNKIYRQESEMEVEKMEMQRFQKGQDAKWAVCR